MNYRALVIVAGVGLAAVAVVAVILNMPLEDALLLAAYSFGAAAVVGVAGTRLLHRSNRRSIGTQVTITALTSVSAVAAGAMLAANRMYLSSHDLRALGVVLTASSAVAVLVALMLGQRVAAGSRRLQDVAQRIGRGEPKSEDGGPLAGELTTVAVELEGMSRRLDESRSRERALDASRRELVAWVSHDLRTPLAGILAMAEALQDGVVSDEATTARYHRAIVGEAERLSGLVEDLFELSRINSGTLRLQLEQVSLGDLVSDALSASAGVARANGVKLEGKLAGDAPHLELSASEIGRVVRNLLDNAIRHTPSDGVVTVEAGADDDHAWVLVADSCGGIPGHDIDRVFEMAFRGTASRSPHDGGAGLGLAIARGIVEAHEGEIDVRNEGRGCVFTVRLPRWRDMAPGAVSP